MDLHGSPGPHDQADPERRLWRLRHSCFPVNLGEMRLPTVVSVGDGGGMVRDVDGTKVQLVPMTSTYAVEVVTWRYSEPYGCYDMTDADPHALADPVNGFHAVLGEGALVGFRSFGPDGQVPGGDYDDSALDTGGGLRPELTGIGLGRRVIAEGLAYGRVHYSPAAFRVTVAQFNVRALSVVRSFGFREVSRFAARTDGRQYHVLVRSE